MSKFSLLLLNGVFNIALLNSSAFAVTESQSLQEEKEVVRIRKDLQLEPQKTVRYGNNTFAIGEVPGDGSCIIHTLNLLFPEKKISKPEFIEQLRKALAGQHISVSQEETKDELAGELYEQLGFQCLASENNPLMEFKGKHIHEFADTFKLFSKNNPNYYTDNKSEIVYNIQNNQDVLDDILASLSNTDTMLSLADPYTKRIGTFGLACKIFNVNLDVFTQTEKTDNLVIRAQFPFGNNSPTKHALFATKGAHVTPICPLDDVDTRKRFAEKSLDMVLKGEGVYRTFSSDMRSQSLSHDLQNGKIHQFDNPYIMETHTSDRTITNSDGLDDLNEEERRFIKESIYTQSKMAPQPSKNEPEVDKIADELQVNDIIENLNALLLTVNTPSEKEDLLREQEEFAKSHPGKESENTLKAIEALRKDESQNNEKVKKDESGVNETKEKLLEAFLLGENDPHQFIKEQEELANFLSEDERKNRLEAIQMVKEEINSWQ